MNNQEKKYIDTGFIENQLSDLRQIVFEVTDLCNLNCKYCGYGDFYNNYDKREKKGLSIEKATLFMDYIFSYWKNNPSVSPDKYIYIGFYGGELNASGIKAEMERRELTNLMGGDIPPACCTPCGCEYAGQQYGTGDSMWGGASTQENHDANGAQVQDN